jgi:hypothetical protein
MKNEGIAHSLKKFLLINLFKYTHICTKKVQAGTFTTLAWHPMVEVVSVDKS